MRSKVSLRVALLSSLWLGACAGGDGKGMTKDEAQPTENDFELQAARGAALYAKHCAVCHGASGQGTDKAPRLVGLDQGALPEKPPPERQLRDADFVTVADVAGFVVANMPLDQGGSLSNDEYLAILAFDLKANGINLDEALSLDLAAELTIPR
jgi:thiosulfate dehydrogenase